MILVGCVTFPRVFGMYNIGLAGEYRYRCNGCYASGHLASCPFILVV